MKIVTYHIFYDCYGLNTFRGKWRYPMSYEYEKIGEVKVRLTKKLRYGTSEEYEIDISNAVMDAFEAGRKSITF